jgi:glycosyltransferase involved in cell wall biosynthesis
MRIGLVSYEYPPQTGFGGVGSYTFRLAGALGKAGHEVIVLAGPSDGPEIFQINVTIHRLPARYDPPLPTPALRWVYWHVFSPLMERANGLVWHWLRWDLASGNALADIHRATPLDIIEAPEHAANALMVGRKQLWPMVLRIHGPWDLFFPLNHNEGLALNCLLAALERASARWATILTTPSRAMARFMQRRWALSQTPRVIPNFIDVPAEPPPLPPDTEPPRIICAGRLEPFKGQHILVQAFTLIARTHPSARLVLVGPDQWHRRHRFAQLVDTLVRDPQIRQRIELTGPQPLSKTQEHLARSAIAVVPSCGFESFSFSTLEAMAAARPVVVARSGAMPELLEYGRCGRIVPPNDVPALAQTLDQLLSDRSLRRKLALAAHARALREYDTAVVLPRILQVYQEAVRLGRAADHGVLMDYDFAGV